MTIVKRGFADVAHGQIHYRHAGNQSGANEDLPLVMLHASPGSSRQLVRLIEDMGATRRVIAPDTPGNGDSPTLAREETTVVRLAEAMLGFLDAMGLDRVDLYGSHTGACIATELAILAPDRVRGVVLDGVSTFTPEELEDILANYAFPFEPDINGAYLVNLFQFCRDQYMFFPWYNRTRAGRRDNGMGAPADLHAWATEVMKAHDTYHFNYRAAFRWNGFDRLPLLERPALLLAGENDPLIDQTRELSAVVPTGSYVELARFDDPAFASGRLSAMQAFFASAQ
ncbi:alpha/beta fold hydrolase [Novosphingobium guangzhouense]|uniref:Alpha/beta hydrolase n=1 Tax=Novosphingobium guangzhouense TaxID=1850347 RepID=A0A2K2FX78_9SPHN|nr:alpha/beta hydrolase [Novosphingobium guangzhouense]PNU03391.1 alpha/beta hydrolase [Novosphingobium guangzhouense]